MQNEIRQFVYIFLGFFVLYFSLFLLVYKTGLNKQTFQSEDFISTTTLPFSLIKQQDFDLNEYYETLVINYPHPDNFFLTPYYLKQVGSKFYSFFPTMTSILILPLYVLPALTSNYDQSIEALGIMSRLGGAYLTALSVAVMWFVIKKGIKDNKKAILLLIIYALGTNSLSTSAQGLWQHSSSQLLNASGLLMIVSNLFGPAGFLFGLATIARPTNLLSLVFFGFYIIFTTKSIKKTLIYAFAAAVPLIWEISLDTYLFGSIFNTGYGDHNRWTANIVEGFLGIWFSPSKGILFTSPVLIFVFYTFYKVSKNFKTDKLLTTVSIIIILHTIILGKWYNWFGGYSWGTRMASDVLPYMVFALIPFVNSELFGKKSIRYAFYIATGYSILYHLSGLVFFDGVWHTIYDGKDRYWLWSIQNSELVFSAKRALFQLGLIENPVPHTLQAP